MEVACFTGEFGIAGRCNLLTEATRIFGQAIFGSEKGKNDRSLASPENKKMAQEEMEIQKKIFQTGRESKERREMLTRAQLLDSQPSRWKRVYKQDEAHKIEQGDASPLSLEGYFPGQDTDDEGTRSQPSVKTSKRRRTVRGALGLMSPQQPSTSDEPTIDVSLVEPGAPIEPEKPWAPINEVCVIDHHCYVK